MNNYPQQHEPWRPDYPDMWLVKDVGNIYEDNEEDLTLSERAVSIDAWSLANIAIKKACNYD